MINKQKHLFFLVILLIFSVQSSLSDTIENTPVGPGIIHHHETREAGPWQIHVLEIDLTNEWIQLETVKANDRLAGHERTSSMADRKDREQHRVVGAINGDFYKTDGIPIGAQVSKGTLLKGPCTRSVFAISNVKQPFIDIVSFGGEIASSAGKKLTVNGVNESRDTNELILFNKYFGTTTETNYWGIEIIGEYLTDQPLVNDTSYLVVVAKDSIMAQGHGNNTIPPNGVVLSGHGTAQTFLNENIFTGDTLSIVLQLPPLKNPITELIGGTPRLIRNGVATVEWENEHTSQSFAYDRHPRTAVGFNQDSTKLYFFAVDGRQPGFSVGMSLFELADYMLEWGIYQGINLDGGGSTTMVVRGKVANSPSDAAGERSVANALMVVSTASTGPLSILKISPKKVFVLSENASQFSTRGFDQYYNPVLVNPDSLKWSCDQNIGTIDRYGLFTADINQDSGFVYATFGNARDSARVYITKIASIELQPNPVILKIGEQQTITPKAKDLFSNLIYLSPIDFEWSVTGDIGTIANNGVFTSRQRGQGFVIARYQSIAGSTAVFVGVSSDVNIDDFSTLSNWSLSGVRVNIAECSIQTDNNTFVSLPSSAKLEYSLTPGGVSAVYLNCSIPLSGKAESVGIHVYGDGKGHWLRGEFQDADNEKFLVNFTESVPGIDWLNSWQYLKFPLENAIPSWSNPSATLNFPITWTKIYLAETDESKKNSGTIYFDDFTAHYIVTDVAKEGSTYIPNNYKLEQNFPNPFNPSTKISFGLPEPSYVKLEVYNPIGERIVTLLNSKLGAGNHFVNFDARQLASGIYLYRLDAGDFHASKKMLIIK